MFASALFAASAALTVASAEGRGLSSTACDSTCKYEVKFDMMWNGVNHPIEYPSEGMFSPFWSVTHDASVSLFREGETANDAVKQIAESGAGDIFMETIGDCDACSDPMMFKCDEMSGTCTAYGDFTAYPDMPYFSFATMHAPSPDWFTGVDSWELCHDGMWTSQEAYLFPLDAGTDAGLTFLSEDLEVEPRDVITNFAEVEPISLSAFYNPEEGKVLPVGKVYVTAMCGDSGSYGM